MSREKIDRLASSCREFAAETETVSRNKLRQLAGLATWISGVLPQLSAYTAMLWAAIACSKNGRVDTAHIRRPMRWLLKFCEDDFQTKTKTLKKTG